MGVDPKYYKIVADCKHYAGYDVENWHGYVRDGYDAKIPMQDLVETYLPSFKSCMKDAQVGSAMCSYNVSPSHVHPPQFTPLHVLHPLAHCHVRVAVDDGRRLSTVSLLAPTIFC